VVDTRDLQGDAVCKASKSWLDCCCWRRRGAAAPTAHHPSRIQACSPSSWRAGHLLRAHQDIHSTRIAIAPRARRRLVQVQANTMASKNICTRCLRIAALPAARPTAQHAALRRTFVSSASKQSSKPRQIHQSARQRAAPGVDSLHQPANEVPPYTTPRGRTTDKQREDEMSPLLQSNNLFHSFSESPAPAIRQRAAVMKQNAYCPHPEHQATRAPSSPHDLESRKTGSLPPAHVRYECPDCGIPVSCSEEHFADDYEAHLEICDQLREINEDDHDLVSGRYFPEFQYPGATMDEAQVNLTNWDTMLYSREFNAVDDERAMRQVTRLLTYPITVGSILHELSPYNISKSGRLTSEGLRSLSGELT